MTRRQSAAPALPGLRGAGAVLLWAAMVAACDTPLPGRGPELELGDTSVRLERGTRIHEVAVGGPRGGFAPDSLRASVGDVVRFTAADAIIHDVAFRTEGLPAGATEFLERTAQRRSPPLVSRGAAWIVSLAEAPPGRYTFGCTLHGRSGVLIVAPD